MEQIVITVDQFATLLEAAFFSNILAVFFALIIYDVFLYFFRIIPIQVKKNLHFQKLLELRKFLKNKKSTIDN